MLPQCECSRKTYITNIFLENTTCASVVFHLMLCYMMSPDDLYNADLF